MISFNKGQTNIVIPLYNQEAYIAECLRSVFAQTYTNFDVTVVNDGSTDYSEAVVREFIDDWNVTERTKNGETENWNFGGRFKLLSQSNAGVSKARNAGIAAGCGEFILPLDADDYLDPQYLEKTVPQMAHTAVGLVATDMRYFGLLHSLIAPTGLTLEQEKTSNGLPVTTLIRRSAFEQTKGYSTLFIDIGGSKKAPGYEDWEMWLSILEKGWKVAVVNEPLFHYRTKPVSMVTQCRDHHAALTKVIQLMHPKIYGEEQ